MKGSYQFEKLEGRRQEAAFLATRAQLRLDGFIPLLQRNHFPPEGKILEVGCAQGLRTQLMAEHFPEAQIFGIDRSDELLAEAQKLKRTKNVSYQKADVYELPFPEASFDFIYVRLVFMHLENPMKALQNLKRVLRPGGKILIEDADRDCMFFEPSPQSFKPFWEKVKEGQRRLGGDPNVGRKLAPYLKLLNMKDVQVEVQNIFGTGPEIRFLTETLLPSLNIYLKPEDRKEGKKAIQDLEKASYLPQATFYHFWFVVCATK